MFNLENNKTHKKSEICTINLLLSIELKIYFIVHSDYECRNHKINLELYNRVE